MIREQLDEHGEVELALTELQSAALAQAAGSRLTVLQGTRPGRHRIKASSYVGTIVTDDLELRIRPKVPIANVLHLVGHAGVPDDWLTGADVGYTPDVDALSAFALLYGRTLTSTLARGPLRGYREHHDELVAMRGRIDLARQLRRPDRRTPIACRYVDFTADIEANRYVKHATRLLLRTPDVPVGARRLCKHGLIHLDEVVEAAPPIDLPERIVHTRLTRHYEPLLALAGLIRRSVTLSDQAGVVAASTFLLDMNALFERFMERALREELRGRLQVAGQERTHLDVESKVGMRPDLVFRDRAGEVVLVGDVKYKLIDDGFGRTADYYQLLAYCTRYGLDQGVLLYATVDGETPPRMVTVEHAGVQLHTIAVDLTGEPSEIRAEVARTAAEIELLGERRRFGRPAVPQPEPQEPYR